MGTFNMCISMFFSFLFFLNMAKRQMQVAFLTVGSPSALSSFNYSFHFHSLFLTSALPRLYLSDTSSDAVKLQGITVDEFRAFQEFFRTHQNFADGKFFFFLTCRYDSIFLCAMSFFPRSEFGDFPLPSFSPSISKPYPTLI